MNDRLRRRSGVTLIELLVVVLLIGILAAIAVPSYIKTLENGKAEEAIALAQMVATTNRMYALDYGVMRTGSFSNTCNDGSACGTAAQRNPCDLVRCKYIAPQNWDALPYVLAAGNGATTSCGTPALTMSGFAGCARRRTTGSGGTGGTTDATYSDWGYAVSAVGVVTAVGTGAPTP